MATRSKRKIYPLICSICGNEVDIQFGTWRDGHNAEPVNSGRCCSSCNDTVVLPARIARIYASDKEHKS